MERRDSSQRTRDDSEQLVAVGADEQVPERNSANGRLLQQKVAVMIGYNGRGYRGSQINPQSRTIEGTLLDAFVSAGCIAKDDASHPNIVGLQRAARTDADSFACCNLILLKLILDPIPPLQNNHQKHHQQDLDDSLHKSLVEEHSKHPHYPLIKHINSFLPNHHKVWQIIQVQKCFNPSSFCKSRVYEYSLPTWLFLPPKPGCPLSKQLKLHKQQHPADPKASWWKDHSDVLGKNVKSIQAEKRASYCILHLMISQIQSVLDQFKGTHNFHNFTTGKSLPPKMQSES
ncbi:hypothetical protein PCASD_02516 [Puccinia coronata f. sp. avenae]|uniref:Pseudouridine synthase I TruA alpha/beta domain-containing protein n=1 Tax=Puccinia coronata f. sp. avenae TaxID=200324 RepID=A0A2N5VMF4_9BASI|nr:hypothetical protein PCASD_02516 [Puccinia coronata f. sp. avenae]